VHGAYAVAVISEKEPDRIVVAKNASPLVIGLGEGETFCASDIPAILPYTKHMLFLEEGEIAVLTADGRSRRLEGQEGRAQAPKTITWNAAQAEKGGYKHFMLKEIHEQPRAIEDTLRGRVDLAEGGRHRARSGSTKRPSQKCLKRVYFIACGTSSHATLYGRPRRVARWDSLAVVSSRASSSVAIPVIGPDRSGRGCLPVGETLDTLAALKVGERKGRAAARDRQRDSTRRSRAARTARSTRTPAPRSASPPPSASPPSWPRCLLLAVYLGRRNGTLRKERAQELLQAHCRVAAPHARATLALDDLVRDSRARAAERAQRFSSSAAA
jgi:glucosamine--fructose-6-phosphate aminotransferase (isomerizing)